MNLGPSSRLKQIKTSGIRRFFNLAEGMADNINLSVGEPDFMPPEHALEAVCTAAKEGKTHYSPTNGIAELREALTKRAYTEFGLNYDPNSEILVTAGGTESIFIALFSLINPGDEVLVTDPGFVLYRPCVQLAGGIPVTIPLLEENSFKPSLDDVTSLVTNRSRVIILNFPNNPTGSTLSYDEVAALAKIAVENDLIVISDEVYDKIVYDGNKHYCLATFPGMRERTLVVNSFSKTYAMTGLRVGYVYAPKELLAPLWLVHQYVVSCVNSLAQYMALAALRGPQDFVGDMVKEFDRRRHMVFERLIEIADFKCTFPGGAFYMFPDIKNFRMDSEKFAEFLAKEAHVITVPGSAFGNYGEGYIRLSYAASYACLEEALDRVDRAVKRLNRNA
jgi:aspartate/methionine/tyrosine aminotransferase